MASLPEMATVRVEEGLLGKPVEMEMYREKAEMYVSLRSDAEIVEEKN